MQVQLYPLPGRDYRPGSFMFQCRPGGLLSRGIALEDAREAYEAGELVATHVGIVAGPGPDGVWRVGEAVSPSFALSPLAPMVDPNNREVVVWFKELFGMTAAARGVAVGLARKWAAMRVKYDGRAFLGMLLTDPEERGSAPNWSEDPQRFFCSEAAVSAALAMEPFLGEKLPAFMHDLHASWWTPQRFNRAPVWITHG